MLTTLREVEALAADWRALESGVNLPMLTAAWVRACASTMPERLRIATVRNNGNSYWLLKIGFDPKWARCSPGILLVAGTVSYAARRGLATYEFLGTPEPWIGAWTTEHHQFAVVRAYPATVRGLAGFSADAARAVARRAKAVIGNSHGSEAAPALSEAQSMSQSSAGQVEAFR